MSIFHVAWLLFSQPVNINLSERCTCKCKKGRSIIILER